MCNSLVLCMLMCSPVILDCGSVDVLVGVGIPLRWKSIHLLVDFGSVCVQLCPLFLAGNFVLALLKCEGIASESLLQLSRLRVEAIIVLPLVFEIQFIIHSKSECTDKS